jgi:hypothetical protein
MVFNVVKVLDIEPGAELDDTVYDQWVRIEYQDYSLSLFDMNMKLSEEYVGDYVEIKIDAMFTELEAVVSDPPMAKGNRFCGKIATVRKNDSIYEHVVDLEGLKVTLCDHVKYKVGTMIRFKARLDVVDVRGSKAGWTNA